MIKDQDSTQYLKELVDILDQMETEESATIIQNFDQIWADEVKKSQLRIEHMRYEYDSIIQSIDEGAYDHKQCLLEDQQGLSEFSRYLNNDLKNKNFQINLKNSIEIKQAEQEYRLQIDEIQMELKDMFYQQRQLKNDNLMKISQKYLRQKQIIENQGSDLSQIFLCAICLNNIELNQKATLLDCQHVFHSSELKDWRLQQQNCPLCRRRIC